MNIYIDPASIALGFGLGVVATFVAATVVAYILGKKKANR